jgi:hypothetical protein
MRRLLLAGALLGSLIFASSTPAQAQYYSRRPMARAAARLALPPYGGYGYGYGYSRPWYGAGYYRPRPYYGPRYYGGYSGWGYGPGAYVGLGVF